MSLNSFRFRFIYFRWGDWGKPNEVLLFLTMKLQDKWYPLLWCIFPNCKKLEKRKRKLLCRNTGCTAQKYNSNESKIQWKTELAKLNNAHNLLFNVLPSVVWALSTDIKLKGFTITFTLPGSSNGYSGSEVGTSNMQWATGARFNLRDSYSFS